MRRMSLSTRRAAAVMQYLIGDAIPAQYRLEKERFTLISNGDAEPIDPRGINADEVRDNRRVEIIVTENVVQDYQGNQGGPDF
jgi:flagellar motor protein MotB